MTPWEKLSEKHRKERIKLVLDNLKKYSNKSQTAKSLGIRRQRLNGFIVDHKLNIEKDGK